jgi:putative SOS response-associated peptidase YedK
VIRLHSKTGHRHVDWLTWDLLPHGTTDPDNARRPIHARAETITDLPMFADAFRRRRAIVPATEYYQRKQRTDEWFAITRRDWQPLAIAGLWEACVRPNGDIERTYCIITVTANATVAPIHDHQHSQSRLAALARLARPGPSVSGSVQQFCRARARPRWQE